MPDDHDIETKRIREKLRQELQRTRLSPEQLSHLLKVKAGLTLAPERIRGAVRKNSKRLDALEWQEALVFLNGLPDAPRSSGPAPSSAYGTWRTHIPITDLMVKGLRAELNRTGVRLQTILSFKPPELEGLTSTKISTWKTRRTKKVLPAEWEFVVSTLRSLPDEKR